MAEYRATVLIVYYSRTGNTRKMADEVAAGVVQAGGLAEVHPVEEFSIAQLNAADALIVGSPTYFGHPAAEIQQFFDRSVSLHGKLENKVGAAFASSHNIGGGNETTVLHILESMLVHGMIVQGIPEGDHFGPVSVGSLNRRAASQCRQLGQRTVDLCRRLRPSDR